MDETVTLDTAINDAVKTEKTELVDATGDKTIGPKADDKPVEGDKPKDDKKPAESNKYGLSETEHEQALQLFAGLKDPKSAPTVIDFLAKQAGYDKIENKKEATVAKKDLRAMLAESLGPEFEYLADKMAPALNTYVDEKLAETTADIRGSFERAEHDKIADQTSRAMTSIAQDFFGVDELPPEVISEMSKLFDKMPPSADTTPKEYVKFIFNSVVGEKGLTKVDKNKQDRINKNRTDAPSRLASQGNREPIPGDTAPTYNNLTEAVKAAVEAAESKLEK